MFSGSSSADDTVNLGGINELDLLPFFFIPGLMDLIGCLSSYCNYMFVNIIPSK